MTTTPGLWITAAARTAFTARSRGQAGLDAGALSAQAVAAVTGPAAADVAAVVLGNCTGPGGNLGRIAALAAGLGEHTPGWSVDAQCGAGLAGVLQALGSRVELFVRGPRLLAHMDAEVATHLQEEMPRLQDMFTGFVRELRPEDLSGSAGTYQLRAEILRRVNLIAAPGKVDAVLIEEMLVQ